MKRDRLKCSNCGTEIPEASHYCLQCGKGIQPDMDHKTASSNDSDDDDFIPMLLIGLAFMMFFFALAPMLMGIWIGGLILVLAGLAMVGTGVYLTVMNKKHKDEHQHHDNTVVKLRCRYCGTLNEQTDSRCSSCGANL